MSEAVTIRPNIFLTAIGWLFLVIVAFVLSRASLLFPIGFVPVITVLLSYNLYIEHPSFRRVAISIGALSVVFCLFTFYSSIAFAELPDNLLKLGFNYTYMILLTTWLFVIVSGSVTTLFILMKVIRKHSSAMIMFLSNIIVFMAGFYCIRWLLS